MGEASRQGSIRGRRKLRLALRALAIDGLTLAGAEAAYGELGLVPRTLYRDLAAMRALGWVVTERRRLKAKRVGRPHTTRLRLSLTFFAYAADDLLVEAFVRVRAEELIEGRPAGERFAHHHRRSTIEAGTVQGDYIPSTTSSSTPPGTRDDPLEEIKEKLRELSLDLYPRNVSGNSECMPDSNPVTTRWAARPPPCSRVQFSLSLRECDHDDDIAVSHHVVGMRYSKDS